MKRISKIMSLTLAVLLLLSVFCGCASNVSYAGTWYNGCNPKDDSLILTKDGKFSNGGTGGEYTIEDGKIILVASFISATGEIRKVDGETAIIDGDGEIWFKSKAKATSYYEKGVKKIIENTEKKYSDEVVGSYKLGYYNFSMNVKYVDAHLKMNSDGTYEFSAENDTWQKGTWSFVWSGSLPDESDGETHYAHIELTKTDGSGDKYMFSVNDKIYMSELPECLYFAGFADYRWFKD